MARCLVAFCFAVVASSGIAQTPSEPVKGRYFCLEVDRIKQAGEEATLQGMVNGLKAADPLTIDGQTAQFSTPVFGEATSAFRVDGNHNGLVVMSGGYLAIPDPLCVEDRRAKGMKPNERRLPQGNFFLPKNDADTSVGTGGEIIPACEYKNVPLAEHVSEDADMYWRTLVFNDGDDTLTEFRVGSMGRTPSVIRYSCAAGEQN